MQSIIVDSSEKIAIIVRSVYGYLIFHRSEHNGVEYYAPRAIESAAMPKLAQLDQFDKFCLNEPVEITILGPKNTNVKVILRLKRIYSI